MMVMEPPETGGLRDPSKRVCGGEGGEACCRWGVDPLFLCAMRNTMHHDPVLRFSAAADVVVTTIRKAPPSGGEGKGGSLPRQGSRNHGGCCRCRWCRCFQSDPKTTLQGASKMKPRCDHSLPRGRNFGLAQSPIGLPQSSHRLVLRGRSYILSGWLAATRVVQSMAENPGSGTWMSLSRLLVGQHSS